MWDMGVALVHAKKQSKDSARLLRDNYLLEPEILKEANTPVV